MVLPRKRRVRAPRGWSEGLADLHDYLQAAPRRVCASERDRPIIVTDDWPKQVPIGDAELRAIEGHMRQELDKLFGTLP